MFSSRLKYLFLGTFFVISLIILYRLSSTLNKEIQFKAAEETKEVNVPTSKRKEKLFNIDFHYILNSLKMCYHENSIQDSDIEAVILVTSYFGNIETRSAMRRAFSLDDLQKMNFRRVFLLGRALNDTYTSQKSIENESKRFGDIIQGNFIEAYRNLTYKHIMGLKWAKESCASAKFIIKMDDDIVVNIDRIPMLLTLIKNDVNTKFISGYVLKNMVPIREPANKWYVTKDEYQLSYYPLFVSGWFYITTPEVCSDLYNLSQHTKYFWIDDTYVTGILARRLNLRYYDISRYFSAHSEFLDCCLDDVRSRQLECEFIIGPNGGNNNLFYEFNNAMSVCSLKLCSPRTKPINETCVAKKKFNLGHGNAAVSSYKLH